MNKSQIALTISGLIILLALVFFGKTVPSKVISSEQHDASEASPGGHQDVISQFNQTLSAEQLMRVKQLQANVDKQALNEQKIAAYHDLNHFYSDTLKQPIIGKYYIAEAAKLENTEKKLTFAAHLFLDELMVSEGGPLQTWIATQAKDLFEKALLLNPGNDSAKVGIATCYLFGNITENPMQGITILRDVTDKDPGNVYAHMVLGLGGIKSGQYDKAIENFLVVLKKQPDNLEVVFNLAETYERKGDKQNALIMYKKAKLLISIPEAKNEIDRRIQTLQ